MWNFIFIVVTLGNYRASTFGEKCSSIYDKFRVTNGLVETNQINDPLKWSLLAVDLPTSLTPRNNSSNFVVIN